jgi:hypothetical protein
MRFFNTAGPVNPQDHYCLPPLERFHLREILVAYVTDLGLIKQERNGALRIANPIYQEVIPRDLTWSTARK